MTNYNNCRGLNNTLFIGLGGAGCEVVANIKQNTLSLKNHISYLELGLPYCLSKMIQINKFHSEYINTYYGRFDLDTRLNNAMFNDNFELLDYSS